MSGSTNRMFRSLLQAVTRRRLLGIAIGVAMAAAACAEPELRVIEKPENVLALQNDVVAFKMGGDAGAVYTRRLPVDRLGPEAASADSLLLLRYSDRGAEQVARMSRAEGDSADLQGGETYLLYALPTGHIRTTYKSLCQIQYNRPFIDRVAPDLYGRLCPLILCPAEPFRLTDLSQRLPDFARAAQGFDFDPQPIGGFGPGTVCDQCTGTKSFVMPTIRCGARPPAGPSTCSNPLLQADFEADVIGSPPSTSPVPDPPADMLIVQASLGDILVISSGPLGSKAVTVKRGSTRRFSLAGVTEPGPHTSGQYRAEFRAYATVNDANTPEVEVAVEGPGREAAFRLRFDDLGLTFVTGTGSTTVGSYSLHVPQAFVADLDLDAGTVALNVDGTTVASGTFLDAGFSALDRLVIRHVPPILEAFEAEVVADDLRICKM